jgi:DNA-binding response OmpR family regulator
MAFSREGALPVVERVLIIDDDENIRDMIGLLLEREHFLPEFASDGRSGLEKALVSKPSLLLVDLRLPDMSGFEVCKQVRAAHIETPIIVLSAVADEVDKVLLLETGADDYVVKPFGGRELLARIRAVLRRTSRLVPKVFRFSDVEVDPERHRCMRGGEEIKLTATEYNLLLFFLENPDKVLTRDTILNRVWGYQSYPTTRTVDAHVVRLRQKFDPNPEAPRHFFSVHCVGYRFVP